MGGGAGKEGDKWCREAQEQCRGQLWHVTSSVHEQVRAVVQAVWRRFGAGVGLAGPLESVARALADAHGRAGAQVLLSAVIQGTWDGRNSEESDGCCGSIER
jgi:hypothetical protein